MYRLQVFARRNDSGLSITLWETMITNGGGRVGQRHTHSFPLKSTSRTAFWWLVYTLIRVRITDTESQRGERHVYREASADMLPLHGPGLLTSNSVATARYPAQSQILVERRESKDADERGLLVG